MKQTKTIGRFTIHPDRGRSKDEPMGRFGGGWQFRLGVTAGSWSKRHGMTVLLGLGVREYRVQISPRKAGTNA